MNQHKPTNNITRLLSMLAIFVLAGVFNSQADFRLRVDFVDIGAAGSFEHLITDENTGIGNTNFDFFSGGPFSVGNISSFISNLGVTLTALGGTSKPIAPNDKYTGANHLSTIVAENTTLQSRQLVIEITDTDYSTALGTVSNPRDLSAAISVTDLGGTSSIDSYIVDYDTTNTEFGANGEGLDLGGISSTGGLTASRQVSSANPYAITQRVIVTVGAGESVSFGADARVTVPEPGTMLLLGSGILGFAIIRRRKERS